MSAAAWSSETSPGSSRATTISLTPARSSAAISLAPISVPFLSTRSPWRIECTAVAPSASLTGTAPNFMPPPPLSAFSRSVCVISAMMATAISAGDTAPIGSPMGAWMRAMAASVTPASFSRSTRLAWVFLEPSAPI